MLDVEKLVRPPGLFLYGMRELPRILTQVHKILELLRLRFAARPYPPSSIPLLWGWAGSSILQSVILFTGVSLTFLVIAKDRIQLKRLGEALCRVGSFIARQKQIRSN